VGAEREKKHGYTVEKGKENKKTRGKRRRGGRGELSWSKKGHGLGEGSGKGEKNRESECGTRGGGLP